MMTNFNIILCCLNIMNQIDQIRLIGKTQSWFKSSEGFLTDQEFFTMHKNTVSLA